MNELTTFSNPMFGEIRTAGTADNPMFCLTDICKILALDASQVMKRLDDGVVTIHPTQDSLGRTQQTNFVNEDGLYDVILDSRKPEAKAFRKWVTSEVLPSIRKHGAYMTESTLEKALTSPDFLIQLATQLKEEKEKRIAAEQESQRKQLVIDEQQPKVVFADAVVGSKSSCLIGELAKILTQNGYKIGQNRLFEWLRNNHYLGSRGEFYNIPMQQYIDNGLFELKKTTHSENGVMRSTVTTKVTGKGQSYFINKFLNKQHIINL
jgi:prophage antirepressor-like protein